MIGKLLRYIKEAVKTKYGLKKNSKYLKPGKYIINSNLNLIYSDDVETVDYIERIFLKNNFYIIDKSNLKKIIKKIVIPKKIYIPNNKSEVGKSFNGSVYFKSQGPIYAHDIKTFDIKKLEVLSIYEVLEGLNKKIKIYKYFYSFFNMPKIISYSLEEKILVEELVEAKPRDKWNKENYDMVIKDIFNTYDQYYKNTKQRFKYLKVKKFVNENKSDKFINKITNELKNITNKDLLEAEFPKIKQHGDLWFANIILDKREEKIFYIDWDFSDEYVFFYDLFTGLSYEAIRDNNYSYINRYLTGGYDKEFTTLFSNFYLQFDPKERKVYLLIFIIESLQNKVANGGRWDKVVEEKYFNFIKKINIYIR